ncbi:MAG TPA: peptidoglycan-associated lipoprotein Pal [Rhodospirillales bacterium]|jgi:peptidoglycan-associated lipoprotein|nr:peptidoglycan-associated lipoprotein Pal [Rhodospirillales bacterium]|tara:strand:+ start:201 stop:713 length:513 start_codon:yes stop_codon:yes gene_type:complete
MHLKILGLFVAVALIAACETAPEGSAGASGAGKTKDTSLTLRHTAKPAAGSQNDLLVNVGDRVFFDYDKYNVSSQARQILVKQAAWMKKYPALIFTIEGHCDERGTREYNLALGERRANAIKDYLATLGINSSRLKTISYGKERPVALGSNEQAWSQNRRAVTVVGVAGS